MVKQTGTDSMDTSKVTTVAAIAYDIQKQLIRKLTIALIIALVMCGVSVVTAIYSLSGKHCDCQSHIVGMTAVTSAYLGRYIRQGSNKTQLLRM